MKKNSSFVITGVYLPPSGSPNYIEKYKTQLSTIQGIHRQFSSTSESIIMGDFQCCPEVPGSLRNASTNSLSPHLTSFLEDSNLTPVDMTNGSGPTYTYHHLTMPNQSYIDHILSSQDLSDKMFNVAVLDPHPLNTNDHLPVVASVRSNNFCKPNNEQVTYEQHIPNYMWNNSKFKDLYNECIVESFAAPNSDHLTIEQELTLMYEKLKDCASRSLSACECDSTFHRFKPKKWWNNSLSESKKKLI